MTVRIEETAVFLEGRCQAADAEILLTALQEDIGRPVDLGGVQRMHFAVAQILLVARPPIRGLPDDEFLRRHIVNLLQ